MALDWIVPDHDRCDRNGSCVMKYCDAKITQEPLEFFQKRRAMVEWTLVKALVVAVILLSSQGKQTLAYYYEYPINMLGRAATQRQRTQTTSNMNCVSCSSWNGLTKLSTSRKENNEDSSDESDGLSDLERDLLRRVSRLEALVSKQEVELRRLKKLNEELTQSTEAFAKVIQLLKEAGLGANAGETVSSDSSGKTENKGGAGNVSSTESEQVGRVVESFDDSMIFGTAPSSVNDAADAAGAAILAAMLGGKQRMLVDVRDAELSSDAETLVQFIELAILPIAAGLEGLKSTRNRVKIVFPKVSQLLEYRRTMALAAPEVVALSTLGFDPVERRDKLVVIVAPEPDDEEGLVSMRELLYPSDSSQAIQQPVVILNYHMVPVSGLQAEFETAYHLRLLTVHYMSGEVANELLSQLQSDTIGNVTEDENDDSDDEVATTEDEYTDLAAEDSSEESRDEAVEAAVKHAQQLGVNQGVTRAMVIRAYPRPWHVFVDTSPDTDTDFEVAATFDEEPTLEELNMAIVECLEGSEREDELVAQQMQQALEEGQLDRVSEWIGEVLDRLDDEDEGNERSDEDFDMFEEDSV